MGQTGFTTAVDLDRDGFLRRLIASLGHLNESILGSRVAGAYVMNVGLSMGAAIEAQYKQFWGIDRSLTLDEYAHVIVDLKQKIKGNFSLVSKDADKVVVRTTSCPFDEFVRQSPSLCFMTSSVFGGIAARNFGYAKVALLRRIAIGDPGCLVAVYLRPSPESAAAFGHEYSPDADATNPDITEQLRLMDSVHRLHQQLTESNAKWQELVQGAAEAVCVVNSEGNVDLVNTRWRELFGIEGVQLRESGFAQIVNSDDLERGRGLIERVLSGERILGEEFRLIHRDRHWLSTLVSAGPIRDDVGVVIGALVIVRDVTEQREIERLKDAFLATASHEVRTPVATIRGMTDLLLRKIEKDGTIDVADLTGRLRRIQHEADRLATLGTDLSDVGRLRTGRLTTERSLEDLRLIVAQCFQQQLASVNTSVFTRMVLEQPSEPVSVFVDRGRMAQVIRNLLDNAQKYSPEGGRISVTTRVDGNVAQVTVVDEGIGIPLNDIYKIFTPFYRGSNASVRNFNGLGLGLYLSKAVVEAHGGDLRVTSEINKGATFELTVPILTDG